MDENTRLWVAIEAPSRGRGGITLVSNATGLSRTTITTAIKEFDEADESVDNIRRPRGSVGIDGNTPEFAYETIRHWGHKMGVRQYNHAQELLITADGGGSNGGRNRLWKVCLQKLADGWEPV